MTRRFALRQILARKQSFYKLLASFFVMLILPLVLVLANYFALYFPRDFGRRKSYESQNLGRVNKMLIRCCQDSKSWQGENADRMPKRFCRDSDKIQNLSRAKMLIECSEDSDKMPDFVRILTRLKSSIPCSETLLSCLDIRMFAE